MSDKLAGGYILINLSEEEQEAYRVAATALDLIVAMRGASPLQVALEAIIEAKQSLDHAEEMLQHVLGGRSEDEK